MCAAAPPPGATNCSGCHALGGSANELTATMLAYRSGERPSTVMGRLMKGLTTEQIQDIADWVAEQK
jgi:cytochrome c553